MTDLAFIEIHICPNALTAYANCSIRSLNSNGSAFICGDPFGRTSHFHASLTLHRKSYTDYDSMDTCISLPSNAARSSFAETRSEQSHDDVEEINANVASRWSEAVRKHANTGRGSVRVHKLTCIPTLERTDPDFAETGRFPATPNSTQPSRQSGRQPTSGGEPLSGAAWSRAKARETAESGLSSRPRELEPAETGSKSQDPGRRHRYRPIAGDPEAAAKQVDAKSVPEPDWPAAEAARGGYRRRGRGVPDAKGDSDKGRQDALSRRPDEAGYEKGDLHLGDDMRRSNQRTMEPDTRSMQPGNKGSSARPKRPGEKRRSPERGLLEAFGDMKPNQDAKFVCASPLDSV
ncbi:unnamed protein product [Protopolystoma xenopodis]|uniref:Uncharacterized protein n=1 Tax=Protopolystoma xenopodis TaxID=117903 RepID=A0A448XBY4_9PLAT|nr:unnamed protein product [Protopolystoma xenopodis]